MAEVPEVTTSSPADLIAAGRRHLAVKDFSSAVESLAKACELLAQEHGDSSDKCAEGCLWYGKALLGLFREEIGVLGNAMPGTKNTDDDEDDDGNDDDNDEQEDAEEDGENDTVVTTETTVVEKSEAESTTNDEEPGSSSVQAKGDEPGSSSVQANVEETGENAEPTTSNGEANDESIANVENEDDVDNLQLAWETLDLARSILERRVAGGGGEAARSLLADAFLALGEVALESATYDKAVADMQSSLDLQKEIYRSDDRRIAETHYQIGLANSLATNFDDAITHFKNAVNILESRIKMLEDPTAALQDATVKKYTMNDPFYTLDEEIQELKELLPEIQEKIQDTMDYKAETLKRVNESLFPSNGEASSSNVNGASSSTSDPKPAPKDISHLIKRKRKSSEGDADSSAAKKANT